MVQFLFLQYVFSQSPSPQLHMVVFWMKNLDLVLVSFLFSSGEEGVSQ